jgi:hypothetical protein
MAQYRSAGETFLSVDHTTHCVSAVHPTHCPDWHTTADGESHCAIVEQLAAVWQVAVVGLQMLPFEESQTVGFSTQFSGLGTRG